MDSPTQSGPLGNIPTELRSQPLWLPYYGSKHPILPYGTPEARAQNCRTLDEWIATGKPRTGYSLWIDPASPYTYVDLDSKFAWNATTATWTPQALAIVEKLNSYTEVSASGHGLHIVVLGRLPEDFNAGNGVLPEFYSGHKKNKTISLTGDVYEWHYIIESRQREIEELFAQVKGCEPQAAVAPLAPLPALKIADMPAGVLDGRLGEICQLRLAAFPLAYSWGALVTCAGALVPHGAIRSNLYWCPVGDQGSGKTQAIEQSLNCLGMWPKHECLIDGKFGSVEGMLEYLQGISGANRLLFPDELGHLLEKANIERSAFPYVLNTAYYNDKLLVTMAKGKKAEFDCRLSLAGGVVEELFGDLFGAKTTGGLHGRFIFGLGPKPHTYLYRPYDTTPENVSPIAVVADQEIWEARDEWVKTVPGLTPRIAEHALRVAAICASFDGRKTLHAIDLGPALEFAKYQVRVRILLEANPGENPDAKCAFAINTWLRSNAPNGQQVGRRALYTAIHAARLGPGVFDRALKNLEFNEEIRQSKIGKQAVIALVPDGSTSAESSGAQVLPLARDSVLPPAPTHIRKDLSE